jgi:hypothetical protein
MCVWTNIQQNNPKIITPQINFHCSEWGIKPIRRRALCFSWQSGGFRGFGRASSRAAIGFNMYFFKHFCAVRVCVRSMQNYRLPPNDKILHIGMAYLCIIKNVGCGNY